MATHASGSFTWTSTTVAAAGSQTSTNYIDNTTGDGANVYVTITNGSGLTAPASVFLYASPDHSTWVWDSQQTCNGTASGTVTTLKLRVDPEVLYAQLQVSGNTGGSVTITSATWQQLTAP